MNALNAELLRIMKTTLLAGALIAPLLFCGGPLAVEITKDPLPKV